MAEAEYKANAYGPFWDCIQEAATHLADLKGTCDAITQQTRSYYQTLNGRRHNFPEFPVSPDKMPDGLALANRLYAAARQGQSHPVFANIWEHRATRQLIKTGFASLGQAINNISSVLSSSIDQMNRSLVEGNNELIDGSARQRRIAESTAKDVDVIRRRLT